MKKQNKSRILNSVYESAQALHEIGLIDKRKMEKYNILCLDPIPEYTPRRIKALRTRHNISQSVLAIVMNTSLSTVQKWEIGEKRPSGPSLKLLNILDTNGIEVFLSNKIQSDKHASIALKY